MRHKQSFILSNKLRIRSSLICSNPPHSSNNSYILSLFSRQCFLHLHLHPSHSFYNMCFLSFEINSTIFVLALRSVLSTRKMSKTRTLRSTRRGNNGANRAAIGTTLRNAKVVLKSSAILLPILGLTWLFGLLVFDRDTIVFKYLFAICNSLQGMMIFLFHVVINRKVSLAFCLRVAGQNPRFKNTFKIF